MFTECKINPCGMMGLCPFQSNFNQGKADKAGGPSSKDSEMKSAWHYLKNVDVLRAIA